VEARFPFAARAEAIPENSNVVIAAQATEISLYGCYLEFTAVGQLIQ
jgi:hypothetical protein